MLTFNIETNNEGENRDTKFKRYLQGSSESNKLSTIKESTSEGMESVYPEEEEKKDEEEEEEKKEVGEPTLKNPRKKNDKSNQDQ